MKQHSRYEPTRKALIFWCLFIGIGAVGGAVGMLVAPDGSAMGMQEIIPYFQVLLFADTLFQNFIFPGISLLCVNGISNLIAAFLLLRRKPSGIVCGTVFGGTLMAWIVIQFIIFPLNFMSTIYFIFGAIQAATGYAAWVFYRQEAFAKLPDSFPNIGTDSRRLVVYFSRMGYTRRAALAKADSTGAEVYEVTSTERTAGTPGFWWCGRYGMHRWEMPVKQDFPDLSAYDHVTICSPIWVFHLSAPMRSFCRAAKGKIREVDYILVHHQKSNYANAVREMNSLLGITADGTVSICCRRGKILRRTVLEPIQN